MQKSITVDIDMDSGEVAMQGHNFKGKDCDSKMKEIEEAIGVVSQRTNSPGYNQTNSVQQKIGG